MRSITPAILPPSVEEAANIHSALLRLQDRESPLASIAASLRTLIIRRIALRHADRDTERSIDELLATLSDSVHSAYLARDRFTTAARLTKKAAAEHPEQWPTLLRQHLEQAIIDALDDPATLDADITALVSALAIAQHCSTPRHIALSSEGGVTEHFTVHHG